MREKSTCSFKRWISSVAVAKQSQHFRQGSLIKRQEKEIGPISQLFWPLRENLAGPGLVMIASSRVDILKRHVIKGRI